MKLNRVGSGTVRKTSVFSLIAALMLIGFFRFENASNARMMPPPTVGSIVINEYEADNDANANDFIELLVITDNLDLRGLRLSDNELGGGGTLNNGEAVFVFGNDAFLSSVPKGTTIALYSIVAGVTTDTTTNPASGDWKMILAPGTGFTLSADGLGGGTNAGFANGGEAFYLYLTGADGNSAGTDNVYLDFVSFEADGGNAPVGLTDLNLPDLGDNAFYTGNTAAGNDAAANWTRYDFVGLAPNVPTPGDANPSQDLSNLRVPLADAPTITENTVSPLLNLPATTITNFANASGVIGDPTDPARTLGIDFTIADSNTAVGSLTVTATSSNTTVVPNVNLNLTGAGATRNLKITPADVGFSTITVTVTDGTTPVNYTINYAASSTTAPATTVFQTGKADASTAIAVDADYMFVADDEDQAIRLYDRNESGFHLASFDFTASLGLTDFSGSVPREVDIEASAQIGSRIYWLASHSNSSGGAIRPNRSRLFATDIGGAGAASTLTYVGRYDGLKTDLLAWDSSNAHGLGANYFGLTASAAVNVIPEATDGSGFNIEGMTIAPDGTTGYIAFRAPIVPASARTRALIVPVTNFAALVGANPSAGPATFGAPIQLNLGGRGIRAIKKNAANQYLIVAGTAGGAANFALYTWTGNAADAPILRTASLTGLNPESIVEVPASLPGAFTVQLLSDNGDDVYYNNAVIAKELPNNEFKKFRSDLVSVAVAPTAATVSVGGRVLLSANKGAMRVRVIMTDTMTGERRATLTNHFGYYNFTDVVVGRTYLFQIQDKWTFFNPQIVTVNEELSGLNFYSPN